MAPGVWVTVGRALHGALARVSVKKGISAFVALAMTYSLLAGAPSLANADEAANAAPVAAPAFTPKTTPAAEDTPSQITIQLRQPTKIVIEPLSRSQAEKAIADILAKQQQDQSARQLQSLMNKARSAAATQARALAQANKELQKALEALAKALNSSACTTTDNGTGKNATISCPIDNGGEIEVTGDGDTNVTGITDEDSADGGDDAAAEEGQALVAPASAGPAKGKTIVQSELDAALAQARNEWAALGADVAGITATIADLQVGRLGYTIGKDILIDDDAAGWGWESMSLITTVRHEVGHAVGLGHSETGLMGAVLQPGVVYEVPQTLPKTEVVESGQALTAPLLDPSAEQDSAKQASTQQEQPAEPAQEEHRAPSPSAEDESGSTPAEAEHPAKAGKAESDSSEQQAKAKAEWELDANVAFLVISGKADGKISYDAASDQLVFSYNGTAVKAPAQGITSVKIKGGKDSNIAIDIDGLSANANGMAVDIDEQVASISVTSQGANLAAGSEFDNELLVKALNVVLRAVGPSIAASLSSDGKVDISGKIVFSASGATLEITAKQVEIASSSRVDTGTGDLKVNAQSDEAGVQALITAADSFLGGKNVVLAAQSASDSKSSAAVVLKGVDIQAAAGISISADSLLVSTNGSAAAFTSNAEARVEDSALTAGGKVSVSARNTTSLTLDGATTTATLSRTTNAIVDGASTISADVLSIVALSSGEAWVSASMLRGLAAFVGKSTTKAALGDGVNVMGAKSVGIAASTTSESEARAEVGSALNSLDIATWAVVGTGPELVVAGDVFVRARQNVEQTAVAALGALTLGTQLAATRIERKITAGGALVVSAEQVSKTSAIATGGSFDPAVLAAAVELGVIPPSIALPTKIGALAVNQVSSYANVELPISLALAAGGSTRITALTGGSAIARADVGAAANEGPSVALNLSRFFSETNASQAQLSGRDILINAERGPPAGGTSAEAEITLNTQFNPPANATLILAELGGTITVDGATLTFVPGSLRANAWVLIIPRSTEVAGFTTASPIYDLFALDAEDGSQFHTFNLPPTLTIAVPASAAGADIYYLGADGGIERLATSYDAETGTITASLPHFSRFVAGSVFDSLASWIATYINGPASPTIAGDGTFNLGDVELANGVTLSDVKAAVSGWYAETGSFQGLFRATITLSGDFSITLDGFSISAGLKISYTLNGNKADEGELVFELESLTFLVAADTDGGAAATITAAAASVTMSEAGALTINATAVDVTLAGEVLSLSAEALTVTRQADVAGGPGSPSVPGAISLEVTGATIATDFAIGGFSVTDASLTYSSSDGSLELAGAVGIAMTDDVSLTGDFAASVSADEVTMRLSDLAASLSVGGLELAFSAGMGSVYLQGKGGTPAITISGNLIGDVTLTGLIEAEAKFGAALTDNLTDSTISLQLAISASAAEIFLGSGGKGLSVSDAAVSLFLLSGGAESHYAFTASGELALVGFDGFSASGTVGVRVNNFEDAVASSDLADLGFTGSDLTDLSFTDDEVAVGAEDFAQLTADSFSLSFGGQSLILSAVISKNSDGFTVRLDSFSLGLGSRVSFTGPASGGTASLLLLNTTTGTVTGNLSGGLSINLSEISFSGELALSVDEDGFTVSGGNLTLTLAGQQVSANVTITRSAEATTLALTDGSISISDGNAELLSATELSGAVVITDVGVSVALSGALSGTLASAATISADYVSVTMTGRNLDISATDVSGSIAGVLEYSGSLALRRQAESGTISLAVTDASISLSPDITGVSLADVSLSYSAGAGLTLAGSVEIGDGSTPIVAGSFTASAGADAITMTLSGLRTSFSTGDALQLQLVAGSGNLTLDSAGVSGSLAGSLAITGYFDTTANFSAEVSGDSLRMSVEASGVNIFLGSDSKGLSVSNAAVSLFLL
ncbi:MAG: hypothetical protein LBI99_05575, partial [Propionibacteriaceae bacterium]|nr:hypothetical protein [Propionibacteriaceae bacterium]